jgi:hypothetical protein
MRIALRVTTAVAIVAIALFAAVTTASANRLSIDDQNFTMTWEPLTFVFSEVPLMSCNLTISGSLHSSTILKTNGLLIGHITSASIAGCAEGAAATVLLADLPWHVRYDAFEGTLPRINAVTLEIVGVALRVDPPGAAPICLFRTDAAEPLRAIAYLNSGTVTEINAIEEEIIDLDGEALCSYPGELRFEGLAAAEDTASNSLAITLDDTPTPASLGASPERVDIAREESSDTFTLRNTGGATATIDRVEDEAAAQFDVSGCGATSRIVVSGSCVYTVQVDERPLASGRVTVEYDDGAGGNRRVSIDVDIAGEDIEAELRAEPSSVTIDALEQNDIVEISNIGGGSVATIDRITTTTSDSESPDFTVTTTGCGERLLDDEACYYLISVNSRPEANGIITVEYDDGLGRNRRLEIAVDIVGPDPAELEADPTEVSIERLESNDSFVIRSISPDTAAIVNRAILTADDTGSPEFSVTGFGCPEIYIVGASCTYIVSVNSRPEADGRYAIEYDDGAGNDRTVVVNIDIAS